MLLYIGKDVFYCWLSFRYVVAPCQLPVVSHGQYLLGYRPGLTIGNGSIVRFQCDTEFKPSGSETIVCVLGELRPKSPHCKPGNKVGIHNHFFHYLKLFELLAENSLVIKCFEQIQDQCSWLEVILQRQER